MIIVRSPLRISIAGGGTDLPSYYRRFGGFLVAASIDKYVYITIHRTFVDELIVKYSKLERVATAQELQHPLLREALALADLSGAYLEITSMADIPAGTGLGSSGSFTTALIKALATLTNRSVSPRDVAEQACHIEIDRLGEPVGKQDPYAATHGGINCFQFSTDDRVDVWPLKVSTETLYNLEDNLLLFFTGYTRTAGDVLRDQDEQSRRGSPTMLENLSFVKELGYRSRDALEAGDLGAFAELMNVHWASKRRRTAASTNAKIDEWFELGRRNGALGGKLVGAGGGGFLMFYAEEKVRLRRAMAKAGLPELRFRFDMEGTRVVVQ